jgi:hypothetical protein
MWQVPGWAGLLWLAVVVTAHAQGDPKVSPATPKGLPKDIVGQPALPDPKFTLPAAPTAAMPDLVIQSAVFLGLDGPSRNAWKMRAVIANRGDAAATARALLSARSATGGWLRVASCVVGPVGSLGSIPCGHPGSGELAPGASVTLEFWTAYPSTWRYRDREAIVLRIDDCAPSAAPACAVRESNERNNTATVIVRTR